MTFDMDRDMAWQVTDALEMYLDAYPENGEVREFLDKIIEELTK